MKKINNIRRDMYLMLGVLLLHLCSCTKDETPALIPEYYSSISLGGGHALALEADGTLWAWGFNSNGELGDSTINSETYRPRQIGFGYSSISSG